MDPAAPPLSPCPPMRCIGCFYDLASLDPRALCPECGAAIEESLASLATGNRVVLQQLLTGLKLVGWSMIIGSAAFALFPAGMFLVRSLNVPSFSLLLTLNILIGGGVCPVASAIGWTRVTRAAAALLPDAGMDLRLVGTRRAGVMFAVLCGTTMVGGLLLANLPGISQPLVFLAFLGVGTAWSLRTRWGMRVLSRLGERSFRQRVFPAAHELSGLAPIGPVILILGALNARGVGQWLWLVGVVVTGVLTVACGITTLKLARRVALLIPPAH